MTDRQTGDDPDDIDQLLNRSGIMEPTATQRAVARTLYGLFLALVNQGFTRDEAVVIVSTTVQATTIAGS